MSWHHGASYPKHPSCERKDNCGTLFVCDATEQCQKRAIEDELFSETTLMRHLRENKRARR
jgi:hypothetical protein